MMPSRRLLAAIVLWMLASLAIGMAQDLHAIWWVVGAVLLCIVLADACSLRRPPRLRIDRKVPGIWPVEVWGEAILHLANESQRTILLELFDGYPPGWKIDGMPHTTRLAPGTTLELHYQLQPDQRGDSAFTPAHLRTMSRLGLWQRIWRMGPQQPVKVFPDFSRLLGRTLSATDRHVRATGMIRKRQRGEGTDFRQLRDYRRGDSRRTIDWKATARLQKLISRDYQEERDQQIVFLLDAGRRMLARDDGVSHFDHALDAVLTVGFLAQKQGDAIGLMSFGQSTRWLPPTKGRIGLDQLIAGVYDLQPAEAAPDYLAAAEHLLQRLEKRAFVILITNLRDEDDDAMRRVCNLLSSRHLVMCASLREASLDRAASVPVSDFASALRHAAVTHYLEERSESIRRLGISADRLIDVVPKYLGTTLLNRYMDVKRSGRL